MDLSYGRFARGRSIVLGAGLLAGASLGSAAWAQAVPPAPSAAQAEHAPAISDKEIIVTGSRIRQSGDFQAPTPVTIVGAEAMQQRAITNVADALNETPLFRATTTPATQQAVGGNVGARLLDLRGLGATRTLVLVDGKRFVPSTTTGTVDVNLIPSLLVKRSEVVTGGASAAYGSDAVAGVVNFILDRDFTGLRGTVQAGISQRGDAGSQNLQLAWGKRFAEGRGHFVAAVEYDNSEGMGDCYTRSWCPNEQLVGNTAGWNGLPASIRTGPAGTGTLSSGGLIVANSGPLRGIAFNPDGSYHNYNFGTIYGTNPSPLFTGGGEESGRNGYLDGIRLMPPVERVVAYAHADYEVSDALKLGADFSYGRVRGTVIGSDARSTVTIQRDNAFLPSAIATIMDANTISSFSLGRAFTDLGGAVDHSLNQTYRMVLSAEGRISSKLRWDAYYQYGRNDFRQDYSGNVVASRVANAADAVMVNGKAVCRINADASTANDDPNCVALNLFGSGNISPAARAYIAPSGYQQINTEQHVLAGNLQADLFKLPGGTFSLAGGGEWRRDSMTGSADALSAANAFWSFNGKAISGTLEVIEGYLEGNAPLLADLPMVRKLELNGAVRQTHYSRSSPGLSSSSLSVTTWKVGAVYEPFDMLRLRVTRSRDIRAPNISELFGPVTSGRTTVVDPANGGTQVQVTSYTGANPLLQPEKADTFTVGAVLQPRIPFGRSLNLSVDYFDISINGAISTLGAQTVVNRCNSGATEYCPYVSRDGAGNLLQVQDLLQNVNGQKVRGIDINFAYSTHKGPWGSLDFNVMATRYLEFSTRDSAGITDRVCQTGYRPGTTTGVPCWIVDGNLGWNIGKVRANLHGRYIPPGKFDVLLVGPEDPGYSPSLSNSVNTNRVAGRFYLDMGLNVKVNDQFEVFGVVNNLFDTDPSMAASAQGGTNQVYFDPIGRNFKFGARLRM